MKLLIVVFIGIVFVGVFDLVFVNGKDLFVFVLSFVEEVENVGIQYIYDGVWEFFVGGGIVIFDCDGDWCFDMFLVGGKNLVQFFWNISCVGGVFFFECKVMGFNECQEKQIFGVYLLDFDNDDILDLVFFWFGENLFLKGNGDCMFEVVNWVFVFDGGWEWIIVFFVVYEEGIVFFILVFGNYVDWLVFGLFWGMCYDNFLFCLEISLDGFVFYFELVWLLFGYCVLLILFIDWNCLGELVLWIFNDWYYYCGGQEQFWVVLFGCLLWFYCKIDGWQYLKIWGMGIVLVDLDVDGFFEYVFISMGDIKL